jgi:hypothetical protein
MSALDQQQTFWGDQSMSALADIADCNWDARFVPKADIRGVQDAFLDRNEFTRLARPGR